MQRLRIGFIASSVLALVIPLHWAAAQEEDAKEEAAAPRIIAAPAAEQPKVENIDEKATHQQETLIEVNGDGREEQQVNAFCLSSNGEIFVACGDGPGEIRVLNPDGNFVRAWEIEIKPEAINTTSDGNVLVGGSGKLFRFSPKGKQLHSTESPHAAAIKANAKEFREQAIATLERSQGFGRSVATQIPVYEQFIKQLEAKKEITKQEEQVLASIKSRLEQMKAQLAAEEAEGEDEPAKPKFTEEQIQAQVDNMTARKMRIASISTDDEHVYIASYAMQGYGFDVWKLKPDLTGGEVIVTGLRGCCGQMDVQACKGGIYVAENSRHRVVRYDGEGKELTNWGERDRTGLNGFTSCCNPMNVCFNGAGDVFTAESNTGRIKRFTADGKFVEFIGDVKLVPGCKNVSIAVSPEGDRVYMLDITRNHIVLMKRKAAEKTTAAVSDS